MGSSFAARRAGKKPNATPMPPLVAMARASATGLGTMRQFKRLAEAHRRADPERGLRAGRR